jgi:hypothetical protein
MGLKLTIAASSGSLGCWPARQPDQCRLEGERQEADALHAEITDPFTAWLGGNTPGPEGRRFCLRASLAGGGAEIVRTP